ncbi:MAG: dynamin family protein [bacterium]|nr:dynamin family protein [bacterium]
MSDKNYFSWNNLRELANIDQHLAFIEALLNKHTWWNDEARFEIKQQLKEIKAKQEDDKLNLSVIGEFDSGKSTFINALLRLELLRADVIQGTTVASTVLSYGGKYQIDLQYDDKSKKTLRFKDLQSMSQELGQATTVSKQARPLRWVEAKLPSPTLQRQLRLIDTPGTNALEAWHEEVTKYAISELSDLSVVIVDANRPWPATLAEFVKENLRDILGQCLFVLNKFDAVRPKERPRLLKYVQQRIGGDLKLDNVKVIPFCSTELLQRGSCGEESDEMYQLALESEQHIFTQLARQRTLVQTKRLLLLIKKLFASLQDHIDSETQSRQKSLDLLKRTRSVDMKAWVKRQTKDILLNQYGEQVADLSSKYEDAFLCSAKDREEQIIKDMRWEKNRNSSMTVTEVKEVTGSLGRRFRNQCEEIAQRRGDYANKIMDIARQSANQFENSFKKQYADLQLIDIPLRLDFNAISLSDVSINSEQADDFINAKESEEDNAFGGGALGGAAIGTMLLGPGIGTLAGAFVGSIFGAAASPDGGEVLDEYIDKIRPNLHDGFIKYAYSCSDSLDAYSLEISKALTLGFAQYIQKYAELIAQRLREEEQKIDGLQKSLEALQGDENDLKFRQNNLQSVLASLDKLQPAAGKEDKREGAPTSAAGNRLTAAPQSVNLHKNESERDDNDACDATRKHNMSYGLQTCDSASYFLNASYFLDSAAPQKQTSHHKKIKKRRR